MPPTDPGLDERVCRKLGWGPIGTWDPAFYGYDPHDPECPPCSPIWPPVSSSWELAGKALEELEKHGMWVRVSGPHLIGAKIVWDCAVYRRSSSLCYKRAEGETGPLVIARAIDAALPEPER